MRYYSAWAAAVLLTLLLSTPAASSQWWYVATGADGDIFFVDAESIAHQGSVVSFWDYDVYKKPDKQTVSQKDHFSLDCLRRSFTRVAVVMYAIDGTVTGTSGQTASQGIVPDTIGDALSKFACSPIAERPLRGKQLSASPEETARRLFAVSDAPK